MTKVTLRQLRYFDALATHSHFGRAAAACAISQPALSMQIKELEETLGAVLIERGARQVRLTKLGEEAILRARDILRSIDELADFARASRDRLAGRLRIGMIPTIAPYLLPKVIGKLTYGPEFMNIQGDRQQEASLGRCAWGPFGRLPFPGCKPIEAGNKPPLTLVSFTIS